MSSFVSLLLVYEYKSWFRQSLKMLWLIVKQAIQSSKKNIIIWRIYLLVIFSHNAPMLHSGMYRQACNPSLKDPSTGRNLPRWDGSLFPMRHKYYVLVIKIINSLLESSYVIVDSNSFWKFHFDYCFVRLLSRLFTGWSFNCILCICKLYFYSILFKNTYKYLSFYLHSYMFESNKTNDQNWIEIFPIVWLYRWRPLSRNVWWRMGPWWLVTSR